MALEPKDRLEMVSSICFTLGPMVTIRAVLQFPPRESYNKRVSLESLKGTNWTFVSVNAWMHFPSAEREEFMDLASLYLSPVDRDFFTLSEPAKSTK